MEGYKDRMVVEYRQLSDRIEKLSAIIAKHESGALDFEPSCPIDLLRDQLAAMNKYAEILMERAAIEGVKL